MPSHNRIRGKGGDSTRRPPTRKPNPFSPEWEPDHHKLAAKLLTGERVSYRQLCDHMGKRISPRMLAVVKDQLAAVGVELDLYRPPTGSITYLAYVESKRQDGDPPEPHPESHPGE